MRVGLRCRFRGFGSEAEELRMHHSLGYLPKVSPVHDDPSEPTSWPLASAMTSRRALPVDTNTCRNASVSSCSDCLISTRSRIVCSNRGDWLVWGVSLSDTCWIRRDAYGYWYTSHGVDRVEND